MKVTLLNQKLGVSSKRFTDLGKLNFPKVVIQYFMLKLIFKTAQAASKNENVLTMTLCISNES